MAQRFVDPTKFMLLASVVDWNTVFHHVEGQGVAPNDLASERGLSTTRIIQLRWVMDPAIGYPTGPFTVWRRRSQAAKSEAPIAYGVTSFLGSTLVVFDAPRVFVRAQLSGSGTVEAFAGAPWNSAGQPTQIVTPARSEYGFSGPAITCLVLSAGVSVNALTGLVSSDAADLTWDRIEIVGLPVDGSFNNVLDLDQPQGMLTALTDPRDAALDRFRRGAPFYGWRPAMSSSVGAPAWYLADPKIMLDVITSDLLPDLLNVVQQPAEQQASWTVTHQLATQTGVVDATASPLATLEFGAATDPLISLMTGFGTAYEDVPGEPSALFVASSSFDYMVTAPYENGTNGIGGPLEYAAIVLHPGLAAMPPAPNGMGTWLDGMQAPSDTDRDWLGVTRISWDKPTTVLPLHVGSYALARAQVTPAGPVEAVMDLRHKDPRALQPIGASAPPEATKITALDDRYHVSSAADPNSLLYAAAHQDLFGIWSDWTATWQSISEPPPAPATIIYAEWSVSPGSPTCPGVLSIDLAWDWATRSPAQIDIVGRMYGQGRLGDPPGNLAVPSDMPISLTLTSGALVSMVFGAGGQATITSSGGLGATVEYFSPDSSTLSATPSNFDAAPRRYRVTITGFGLNFDVAGLIGMALWARGIEARAPQRVGPWSARPAIASTADPRPPVINVEHEDVMLTSLADAAGEYHALLEWPASASATGYFVYTASETSLRTHYGLGDPAFSQSLSDRLKVLRDNFGLDPTRDPFTRVNAQPVTDPRITVTLPRGTKDIHLYVVLGLSAGQIESDWPLKTDPLARKRPFGFAAPRVIRPHAPKLTVSRLTDTTTSPVSYAARFELGASPGAQVRAYELYRVRVPNAAIEVDTMGPPLMRIDTSTGGVSITAAASTDVGYVQPLNHVVGTDAVAGSWAPVYYRAVAWASDDATSGQYGGRSDASVIREVLIPPATDPDLSALIWSTPTPGQPDAIVDATTAAPIQATPLGAHRIEAEAVVTHNTGVSELLYKYPVPPAVGATPAEAFTFDQVPLAAAAAGTSGFWRDASTGTTTQLRLRLARTAFDDVVNVRVRITDPLGRMTEQTTTVPATNPVIAPDVSNVSLWPEANGQWILAFETAVPDAIPNIGAYKVHIGFNMNEPPPVNIGLFSADADLSAIAPIFGGPDILSDPSQVPLRQFQGTTGGRTIVVLLRGTGTVRIDVIAPDGTEASAVRTVS